MILSPWLRSLRSRLETWTARPRRNRRRLTRKPNRSQPAVAVESLESRTLLTQLVGIVPNNGGPIANDDIRQEAPAELTFQFTANDVINPATLDGIRIVRSGLDGSFDDGNEVPIVPGFVGIGDQINEVIFRFSETLPDDRYQITIFGSGPNALQAASGPFNNGNDLTREFELDLGAQVVAVVPQPVVRDMVLSVANVSQIADGDTFTIEAGRAPVTFEFDNVTLNGGLGNGVQPGHVRIGFDPAESPATLAARIETVIDASSAGVITTLNVNQITLDGGAFTPRVTFGGTGLSHVASTFQGDSDAIPPDTTGAVGLNHVVEMINGNFEVFDKSTGASLVSQSLDQFWTGARGISTTGTVKPRIIYDPTVDRWFATSINTGFGNSIFIAVSQTGDPTGVWQAQGFFGDSQGFRFNDFATLGIDADGVYITTNNFIGGFNLDVSIYSIPKADLLLSSPSLARLSRFENRSSNLFGSDIQAAVDFGPSDGRAAFLAARTNGGTSLVRFDIIGAGTATPTLTAPTAVTVPTYAPPQFGRQPGSDDNVEISRPTFGSSVQLIGNSLWAAHHVLGPGNASAIRWYEINSTTNAVRQTGLISDGNLDFYYPSIAANASGDVVIGFSGSGDTQSISAFTVTGKTSAGVTTFASPQVVHQGTGTYFVDSGTGRNRWGDYSATVVDPSNPNTFWTFQEFAFGDNTWATGITELNLAGDGLTLSDGALHQRNDTVVVYFNDDDLDPASAEDPAFYQLIDTNGAAGGLAPTLDHSTDTFQIPTGVVYDPDTNTAVLTFASIPDGAYRLRVGIADVPAGIVGSSAAAFLTVGAGSDNNSSFPTATTFSGGQNTALGAGTQIVISSNITPQGIALPPLPGGTDEPGHRDITPPIGGENHVGSAGTTPVVPGAITVTQYNFRNVIGSDPQGNTLFNLITEDQKQRAREIFEIYSYYLGIEFIESDFGGITVATGDMRAVDPSLPVGPGGVGGVSAGSIVIMDPADTDSGVYGGSWMGIAFHEIGHSLGLPHANDLPAVMGQGLPGEPIFPGDYDLVHLNRILRPDATDIDLYRFDLAEAGRLTAEVFAERLASPSLLNSALTLFDGVGNVLARNDDYFSNDAFLDLELPAGTYFIGLTSTGNLDYDPRVSDTGNGGTTDGAYELRLNFLRTPDPLASEVLVDSTGTVFDGDADGQAGGTFDFWFRSGETIFVDKSNAGSPGQDGSLANPFSEIDDAINAVAGSTAIIRVLGNGGTDGNLATTGDAQPYLIGFDSSFNFLEDSDESINGSQNIEVPQGVTLMIDEGAVLKLQNAIIDVGSSSDLVDRSQAALQVLGTPANRAVLTSHRNDAVGGDTDGLSTGPSPGDWGGIVFRADSDFEDDAVFLNYVGQAEISFGGGQVFVDSVLDIFNPVHVDGARPAVVNNLITTSADAAISADPNSFDESIRRSTAPSVFNRDATLRRVGPDIHGNTLVDNTVNALFVRVETEFGKPIDVVTVGARFDDADIVHLITENIQIVGNAGGPIIQGGVLRARESGRLRIDPGIVVKLSGSRIEGERGRSNFIAEGTPEDPIIFTSIFDDRFGRGGTFDTVNDNATDPDGNAIPGEQPDPGDWGGIAMNAVARASFDHAFLAFGGGLVPIEGDFDRFNVIEAIQADLRVTNSRFQDNAAGNSATDRNGRGNTDSSTVFIRGAQPVILQNEFLDNFGAAVSINVNSLRSDFNRDLGRTTGPIDVAPDLSDEGLFNTTTGLTLFPDNRGPLVALNVLDNNGINGMEVRAEQVTVESVWDDTDIVHVVRGEIITQNFHTLGGIRLESSTDASLVVKLAGPNAGFTAAGFGLEIDDRIGGIVQIVGQPLHPVVLTALADDTVGAGFDSAGQPQNDTNNNGASAPAPGDWRSVRLQEFSYDRNVEIIGELEDALLGPSDTNHLPTNAQFLGELAPNDESGDENQRLGFEINGFIAANTPGDRDVYSFTADAGTQVWIDLDRTDPTLNAVVELIDPLGRVLVRSSTPTPNNNLIQPFSVGGQLPPIVNTLTLDPLGGGDFYTSNPHDPSFRVVLPGVEGQLNTYYVRVRSFSSDLNNLAGGQTTGNYELELRLGQTDEHAGSTIRHADIRFATNGIEAFGIPGHSPLLGEAGEAGDASNVIAGAQQLGNLLTTDRATISVSGQVLSPADVDFYQFTLDIDLIQAIAGVNAGGKTWATIFDIDWADGLSRPDTSLAVFDSTGSLIYMGRDSDIADDQPRAGFGNDFGAEERGSAGKLDPFLGGIHLPAGVVPAGSSATYFVAVSHGSSLPTALQATFAGGSGNTTVRLEPANSILRIAEDHIGFNGYTSGNPDNSLSPVGVPVQPVTPSLLDISNALTLSAHVTPFTLGDVQLFVHNGTTIVSVNPLTGATNYVVNNVGGVNNLGYGDIAMRWDGVLFGQTRGINNANSGSFRAIDIGTGTQITLGDDNLVTNPNVGGQWEALAFRYNSADDVFETFAYNNTTADDDNNPATPNAPPLPPVPGLPAALHEIDSNTGAAIDQDPATAGFQAVAVIGRNDITGMAFSTITGGNLLGVTSGGSLINMFTGGIIRASVAGVGFTGMTNGPQNLRIDLNGDGTLDSVANTFFATGTDGRLYAFNASGTLVPIWDTNGDGIADSSSLSIGLGGTRGLAFSTLDFNLWHPTMLRRGDAGHGIETAPDNSRNPDASDRNINGRDSNEGEGGASFYFGMETFATDSTDAYFDTYGVGDAQFGVMSGIFQEAATNASRPAAVTASTIGGPIQNNYNLPGGAQGSLTTNAFSLEGYSGTDRPTLYFNYFIESQGVNSDTDMLDAARVFVSTNGGASFSLLATNNSVLDHELPEFQSVNSSYAGHPQQRVQEIFDDAGDTDGWRQARVDLGDFAGQPNLILRFDFTTAGTFVAPTGGADGSLPAVTASGNLATNVSARAQANVFEGFYIDDILVGFAERGEMVTNAPAAQSTYFTLPDNPETTEVTAGPYQLEIRRATEYGFLLNTQDPDIALLPLVDSNVRTARGATLFAPAGSGILDGDAFALSDGTHTIEFEFDNNGSVGTFVLLGQTVNRVPVTFNAGQSAATVANNIATAVNSVNARFPQLVPDFQGSASSIPTSDQVELAGIVSVNTTTVPRNLSVNVGPTGLFENGSQRTTVTVTREGSTLAALTVNLTDIDPAIGGNSDEVTIVATGTNTPITTLLIPAGAVSATFDLVTVDDSIVDGTQAAVIRATAAGFTSVPDVLDIFDNETPQLTVTITGPTSISESGGTTTATVTRNTPTGSGLIVSLASLDLSEATVPSTVLIPAGSTSANFTITAQDDLVLDGSQTFEIVVFAAGFASASDTLTVLDDLADFPIQSTLTIGQNFTGTNVNQSGFIPPDTMGGVGPNHVVELINGRFAVYNKTNGNLITSSTLDQFWTNAGATFTGFTFDPRILFDPTEDRWIATAINGGAANSIFIAVSDTNDPTGTWRSVQFIGDTVAGTRFNDFDTLGLDADGVYIATNNFGGPAFDVSIYSIPKADVFAATPSITRMTRFENLNPATFGSSIQPAVDFGPSDGRAAFLAARAGAGADLVRFSVLNAAGPGPAVLTTPVTVPVPAYGQATLASQPGADDNIEIVSARLAGYVQEVGDSLWAAHAVVDPVTPANSYIQWYEIDETATAGGAVALLQSNIISDPLFDFYNVSIAANAFGDVVIGFSGSGDEVGGDQFISSMSVVGSTVGGVTTFGTPFVNQLGVDTYFEDFGSGRNRWGDYSATVVDPSNPFRFWTFQEFVFQQDEWGNQVTEIRVPNHVPDLTVTVTGISAINEAGGVTTATVRRTGDLTNGLLATVSTSDGTEATVLGTAFFVPGSDTSLPFNITAVNDTLADGTQIVFITASATGFNSIPDFVDVLDNDRAQITVSIAPGTVSEADGPGAALGTVTRNTEIISLPLMVFLTSGDTSEITVPAFVVIPAGQTSVTFPINTVNELASDGTRNVVIFATAPGFDQGSENVQVTADVLAFAQFSSFNFLGDSNLDRQQGQLLIQGNTISDVADTAILLSAGPRSAVGNPHPGAPLNLPTLNTQRLAHSAVIQNNVLVGFGTNGIVISGDPNGGPAPLPFAKVVNNTIVGSTAAVSSPITRIGALRPGFDTIDLPANDDGSSGLEPIGFAVNFFGQTFTDLFVNNNGNVTFNSALFAFTPFNLLSTATPIIAPFFADVDTQVGNVTRYGQGTVDGRLAFGVTWEDVTYFNATAGQATNSFQLVLIDRSTDFAPGDFDIEFNYERILWETGDASGGVNGLGGSSARVGFSNGVNTAFELPGSAINGAFLDNGPFSLVNNSFNSGGVDGTYVFEARNGNIGTGTVGSGIVVQNNASPTLLNNIVTNTVTAISIDATSQSTVVGTTLFQNNADDATRPANATGSNPIFLGPTDPLFVDAPNRNFYLADDSRAIDSSLNRLAERPALVSVLTPLEIPPSDIFGPNHDAFGQLRVDDPSQAPPPGLGSQIFKDRGAIERADFIGPIARLVSPADNDPLGRDVDPDPTEVFIVAPGALGEFVIHLDDQSGIGIDDSSVFSPQLGSSQFVLSRDGVPLTEGQGYRFSYNANSDTVHLTSPSGLFPFGEYQIDINNGVDGIPILPPVRDRAGNPLQPNQSTFETRFTILLGPELTIDDVATVPDEGDVGQTRTLTFTISLSHPSTDPVSVDVFTSNGTATAGADYTALPLTTVTFSPGQQTRTVNVTVLGDEIDEIDETFFVNLVNVNNARIVDAQGLGTIIEDNDDPFLSIADTQVVEGDTGTVNSVFTLSLTHASFEDVTVLVNTSDPAPGPTAATAGVDYTPLTGFLVTIPAGTLTQTFAVPVIGDEQDENDEQFVVTLSSPTDTSFASPGDAVATGTIINDDNPVIAIDDTSVTEGDPGDPPRFATFTVSLLHPRTGNPVVTNEQLTLGVATSADPNPITGALPNVDFNIAPLPNPLIFAAGGPTTRQVNVQIVGDLLDEFDETFFVDLTHIGGTAAILDGQGVGSILNDDNPEIRINDVSRPEGDAGQTTAAFTVSLVHPRAGTPTSTNEPVTYRFATANGTATAGPDYVGLPLTLRTFAVGGPNMQTISVTIVGDAIDEFDETFFVNLSTPTNATIGDPQGLGTILNDDDPEISITSAQVVEGDTGSKLLVFTVSLSHQTNENFTVDVASADNPDPNFGATVADGDYNAFFTALPFTVGGVTSKTVAIEVNGDFKDEFDETFFVTLSNVTPTVSPAAGIIVTPQGTGTITNDDNPALAINDAAAVLEGDTGTTPSVFTVSLVHPRSLAPTITNQNITLTATAANGIGANAATVANNDFNPVPVPTNLTFAAFGANSQQVAVSVRGDFVDEFNETFLVNLSSPTNASIQDGQGIGTIVNDDDPAVVINDVTVFEGGSGSTDATFTVSLLHPRALTPTGTNQAVTVNATTADNTAIAPGDYLSAGPVTFTFNPGGVTAQPLTVTVNGDLTDELDETFSVNLSGVSATATIGDAQGLGTIRNDDDPVITIDDVQIVEGNSGTRNAVFTVTLSNPSLQDVTMLVNTADLSPAVGAATGNVDYTRIVNQLLTFLGTASVGGPVTTRTVTVPVIGDGAIEGNETFFVRLSSPTNATFGDNEGVGTIIEDDDAIPLITISDAVPVNEPAVGDVSHAVFTVTLSKAPLTQLRVDFATQAGTASDTGDSDEQTPSDYQRIVGTLTFNVGGSLTQQILVPINGDFETEPPENFSVVLSNPINGRIADGSGTGTIIDTTISPLVAEPGQRAAGGTPLTGSQLSAIAAQAVGRWAGTGLTQTERDLLSNVNFEITNLDDGLLAQVSGRAIRIDDDAAGWGWFVDPTPAADGEFSVYTGGAQFRAGSGSPAAGQMDLLTALMHELGHVLGNGHADDPQKLMSDALSLGARRLPVASVPIAAGNLLIPDQQVRHGTPLMLELPTQNGQGAPLTWTAQLRSGDPLAQLAYQLDQTHRLTFTGNYLTNWGGAGEKWMQGDGGTAWYIITPDGGFYRWTGARAGAGFLSGSTRLATLDVTYHADPGRLHNAQQPASGGDVGGSTVTVLGGNLLVVMPGPAFMGNLNVQVAGRGGLQDVSASFAVSVVNQAPELNLPNRAVSHSAGPVTIPLPQFDIDGDAVTYTVALQTGDPLAALAYQLDQTHGLSSNGNYTTNWGGAGEKWIAGAGGAWYFITPSGGFYRWTGAASGAGFVSGSTHLATLDGAYHADPSRLHNAQPAQSGGNTGGSTAALVNGQIVVTPGAGFTGDLNVKVTATDGIANSAQTFTVSVQNLAPELNLPDRTISHTAGSLVINLPAVDGDGERVTYTVTLQAGDPLAALAYQLDQTHALSSNGNYTTNWGGAGEKWIAGAGGAWYFITPDGGFYRWTGARSGSSFLSGSTRLATLDGTYHSNPARLHNAQPVQGGNTGGSTAALVNGNQIVVTPGAGFQGDLVVRVTATDGIRQVADNFTVSVQNLAPELNLQDRTISRTTDFVTVDLPAADGDGDAVSYSVALSATDPLAQLAYDLDRAHQLTFTGNYTTNWGGAGEKWISGAGGAWFFITPDGTLYRWTGARSGAGFLSGSTRIATLNATYHADPARLHNAPQPGGGNLAGSTATIQNGHQLIVNPGSSFLGDLTVTVTATDGRSTVTKSFTLSVVEAAQQQSGGGSGALAYAFADGKLFDELDAM